MLESAVRALAIVACLVVAGSFALFARDQLAGASQAQQESIASNPDGPPPVVEHTEGPRGVIDDGARPLVAPFAFAETGTGPWGRRSFPTLVALLVYGFGLGMLARTLSGRDPIRGRRPRPSRT